MSKRDTPRAILLYFPGAAKRFLGASFAHAPCALAALIGLIGLLGGEAHAAEQEPAALGGGFLLVLGAFGVAGLFILGLRQLRRERESGQRREQVLEREALIRSVIDHVVDGVVAMDSAGTIELMNPAAERLFDRPFHAARGSHIKTLLSERSHARFDEYLTRVLPSDGATASAGFDIELKGLTGQGDTFPVGLAVRSMTVDGRPLYTCLFRDITREKRTAAYHAMQYSLTRVFSDSTTLGEAIPKVLKTIGEFMEWDVAFYWAVDPHHDILHCRYAWRAPAMKDQEARELEKQTLESTFEKGVGLPGRVWASLKPCWIEDMAVEANFPGSRFIRKVGVRSGFGFPVLRGSDAIGVIEVYSRKLSEPNDELVRLLIGLGSQVGQFAERKDSEEQIFRSKEIAELAQELTHQAKVEADRANMAKTDFLANMSHEIRTPMNAVIGMTDVLAETDLSAEQDQYVKIIRSAGENLLLLIDNILDLSKIEAGQIELEKIPFNPAEVVAKTLEMLKLRAQEKSIALRYEIASGVPHQVVGDPHRLRQVLINLVGNAIKFTDRGEVLISVTRNSESRDPGALLFAVSDTGLGIPGDKLETIFDSFSQADTSTTRKFGGTGLGLAICRRLVEVMQGTIWADSEPGQGSVFYFTTRFGVVAQPAEGVLVPDRLKGLKVLLIEHRPTTRLMILEKLLEWGVSVTGAESARVGLGLMEQARDEGEPFELLIVNQRLPRQGGLKVLEKITGEMEFCIPAVVLMPLDARQGDIARCRSLGAVEYLTRMIRQKDLLKKILEALDAPAVEREAAPAEVSPVEETPLSILLAEDSEDNRLLIQLYLKKSPHVLDIAENGQLAYEKFVAGRYDLVLMDMQMPVMDGYTATRRIREWEDRENRAETPVVALTAHALKGDKDKCLSVGCTYFVSKPIKKDRLLEVIQKFSRQRNPVGKPGFLV